MWKYPDGTFRTNPPSALVYQDLRVAPRTLTRGQLNELGYNEVIHITREAFTSYTTTLEKGEDFILREVVLTATLDTEAQAEAFAAEYRNTRNALLAASDWTQLSDAPLVSDQVVKWQVYRQKLRDLPNEEGWPFSFEWPETPAD